MSVLVTGASRGIGRALYDGYLARGETVTGTCRGDPPAGGRWLRLDVAEPAQFAGFARSFGDAPLDLLICNAGVYLDKGQDLDGGYPPEMWAQSFAINVTGVFLTIQALLPALRAADEAKVAIISSQMASDSNAPGRSYIYRASKAAALNLGRNLAADLAPQGISVGVYHPGWVRTDMGATRPPRTAAQSARRRVQPFDALGPATTGCFETWDGRAHPY